VATNKEQDVVVWIRLPKNTKASDLKKMGVPEVACYGGDTCIAATSTEHESGLLVQHRSGKTAQDLLKEAGLNPRADCFGGDTCIV
jgi:hypothetical protein